MKNENEKSIYHFKMAGKKLLRFRQSLMQNLKNHFPKGVVH